MFDMRWVLERKIISLAMTARWTEQISRTKLKLIVVRDSVRKREKCCRLLAIHENLLSDSIAPFKSLAVHSIRTLSCKQRRAPQRQFNARSREGRKKMNQFYYYFHIQHVYDTITACSRRAAAREINFTQFTYFLVCARWLGFGGPSGCSL